MFDLVNKASELCIEPRWSRGWYNGCSRYRDRVYCIYNAVLEKVVFLYDKLRWYHEVNSRPQDLSLEVGSFFIVYNKI